MQSLEEVKGLSEPFYQIKSGANFMSVKPLLEMICVFLVYKCEATEKGVDVRR
jgi:hypothetical protein